MLEKEHKIKVDNDILFFAFRYALGRKSIAPTTVMTNIICNLKNISDNDLNRYILEIKECNDYGMDIDKKNWLNLKKEIENELNYREKYKKDEICY